MNRNKPLILLFILQLLCIASLKAQCIYINEILINGPGSCDGSCNPNTEEWTELYNDCSTPVNIGCYVLTDGEFTVTIPAGTILAPYDYYVIGSNNSGGVVDLNLATCNCTSGTLVGTYSNSDEQAILVNPSGVIVDAVYWGVGDFPVTILSTPVGSCAAVNINVPSPGAIFSHLTTGGANGCSMARDCDSNPTWVTRCGSAISINSSNGSVIPKFSCSDSTICPGTCISFTDLTSGNPSSWNWTFAGATSATNSSSIKNPTNVCYNTPGNFPVTLAATTICGSITVSMPAFIHVTALPVPVITPAGALNFCTGGSVVLQSSTALNYQWYLNNTIIAGATQQNYTATQAGSYTVKIKDGPCTSTSLPIVVVVSAQPIASITVNGASTICAGGTTLLEAGNGFTSYQWLLNNAPIAGAQSASYSVSVAGDYSVIVGNSGGCTDTSAKTVINFSSGFTVNINATDTVFCEGKNATLSIGGSFPNVLWSTGQNTTSIAISDSGKYSVVVSNNAGCFGRDSVKIKVVPLPTIHAGNDTIGDCANGIMLHGSGSGSIFLWSPAETLSNPNIPNPIATPTETTTYLLTVTENNCTILDEVTITLDCGNLYLPTSFSPNGDGNNDVYKAVGNNVSSFDLRIFNRWGELVFISTNVALGWDGTYLNAPAAEGVYVVKVKAFNPLGKSLFEDKEKKSTITLFR